MTNDKPHKILLGRYRLQTLVKFLNIDFETLDNKQTTGVLLKELLRAARYKVDWKSFPSGNDERPNWCREAARVQRELKKDLRLIADGSPHQDNSAGIYRIVKKLEAANRSGDYQTLRRLPRGGKRPKPVTTLKDRPAQELPVMNPFSKDAGEILCGGVVYSLDWGPRDSLREQIYFQLALAIEERCLEDLKICVWCKNLFVLTKTNQRFCCDACRTAANNSRRLKKQEETKKSKFQWYRDKKRNKLIDRARRLLGEDKPLSKILSETGLTQRILKKYLPEIADA